MITKKKAMEMEKTISTLLSQNKKLIEQNDILKKTNKELAEICLYVDSVDTDGYNRIVGKIKEGKNLMQQWEDSIKQVREAKEKYDSLYRELLILKEQIS